MYSRKIGDEVFTWEPSGGLLNAALVMMDDETDSHWSILEGEAIWGPAEGAALEELPGAVKATWGDWQSRHPGTRVLSVGGKEHVDSDPYGNYFSSEKGFRGLATDDERLGDKALIYAFQWEGEAFAVPFERVAGGAVFALGERRLFLYRRAGDSHYRSTAAYLAPEGSRFVPENGNWELVPQGALWDPESRSFQGEGAGAAEPFWGFDTYWYSWSLTHEGSEILAPSAP